MNILKTAAAAALLLLAACQPAAQDTTADEAALRAGTASWISSYNAGDADTIVALYTDDAMVAAPNRPASVGHEAIRAMVVADIAGAKANGLSLQINQGGTGVSGDLGWDSGSWSIVDAGGTALDSGNYLAVWRKAEGKWLMIHDTWNSDRPLPAPAEPAEEPAAS